MPKGIYIRTEEHNKAISKARLASPKLMEQIRELAKRPRTPAQIKQIRELGSRSKTKKQLENARLAGLSRRGKLQPHGTTVVGNDIIKHHNDLCHGDERPDDITLMTHSEHTSLHNILRVKDGTNPFMAINKENKNG